MTTTPRTSLLSRMFLAAAGTCFLFGMAVTVGDVALRAVAARNIPGAIEMTSLSIGLGALLSMPVCYLRRSHVTAKLLSELFPTRFGRPLGLVGALGSVVFAVLLAWIVGANAVEKWGTAQTTADLGLPMAQAHGITALAVLAALAAALAGLWGALQGREDAA